jgi:hypothetical protein
MHETINVKGREQVVSYALPCQVKMHRDSKTATHRDTSGRKWK